MPAVNRTDFREFRQEESDPAPSTERQPRVNGALMERYIGTNTIVHLVCEVLDMSESTALVKAADGAEVIINFVGEKVIDTFGFKEVIGFVTDSAMIAMLNYIDFGNHHLDMNIVNQVCQLHQDPRFEGRIFSNEPPANASAPSNSPEA